MSQPERRKDPATEEPEAEREPALLRYRVAFGLTALLILGIVVTLPFSVGGLVDDLLGPASGRVFSITPHDPEADEHSNIHLAATALDELQLLVSFRVTGHFVCRGKCSAVHRIVFTAVASDDADAEGAPPSAIITMPAGEEAFSQTIQLPIRGYPIHYPFDRYEVTIGVEVQRVSADGSVETLTPAQAKGRLFLTVQELLPRQNMSPPEPVDPASILSPGDPLTYLYAFHVSFERPGYIRVLAVLLVLLVASAAAYAVFLRPLQDLIVNSGALVLGVWGIRAILTPSNISFMTSIDLALSVVIIFLLGAISVRALMYMHDRAELTLLRRSDKPSSLKKR